MKHSGINIFFKHIRNGDYNIRPFLANKTWQVDSSLVETQGGQQGGFDIVWKTANIKWIDMLKRWMQQLATNYVSIVAQSANYVEDAPVINAYRFLYPENDKYFGNVMNISSSLYSNPHTYQSIDPRLIWYYLDHNFYKDYYIDKFSSTVLDENLANVLSDTGSLLILPRRLSGEGVRENTFTLKMNSTDTNLEYTIIDDGKGNLIDTSFDTSTFVDYRYELLSIGFNEKYREYNFINKKKSYVIDSSNNLNEVQIVNTKLINYSSGIHTTDSDEPTGICANLNGAHLEVVNSDLFNFDNTLDFAFSFWIKVPQSQSIETFNTNPIFTKRFITNKDFYSSGTGINVYKVDTISGHFPFDISITNRTNSVSHSIQFAQSSDAELVNLSSTPIVPNSWNHVVCQKTGSVYEIWLNGELDTTQSYEMMNNIQNNSIFCIGGYNENINYLSGSLDEIKIYSKALTETEIFYLNHNSVFTGSAYQTAKIGTISYDTGLAIISDFRPKYKNAFLGKTGQFDYDGGSEGFSGEFKTSTTLYEHEIVCRIPKTDLNMTQNPSTYRKYDKRLKPKEILSNTDFRPYFTTIGLYDEHNNLLAVAKLSNPIKKRKDVDLNIIIRFDM
jgi:hypothetical protein